MSITSLVLWELGCGRKDCTQATLHAEREVNSQGWQHWDILATDPDSENKSQ